MLALRALTIAAIASPALLACSPASGTEFDPSSDLHCSAMATFAFLKAQNQGQVAPAMGNLQQVQQYYRAKVERDLGQKSDATAEMEQLRTIHQKLSDDFDALRQPLAACVDRALLDPDFRRTANIG